jgi:hypothetical protein
MEAGTRVPVEVSELDIRRAERAADDAEMRSGIHWDSHQRRRTLLANEPACLACAQHDRAVIEANFVWESLVREHTRQQLESERHLSLVGAN